MFLSSSSIASVPSICRLDETVVNRIAAGEVVQRPSNAIKELIENSLDAGSKQITITAKNGGLSILQIQDDGHGINVEDFEILCERFTTSKLTKYDDLKNMTTFGFRGEALASITHVAHVTITSKTKMSPCAFKGKYIDSKLVPLTGGKGGSKQQTVVKPTPCAGVNGTIITAEDLFYNMPTRKAALKNTNECYRAILDVVTRYAIHYAANGVSFTCKKYGSSSADFHTPKNSNVLHAIKIAFGQKVAKELIEVEYEYKDEKNISNQIPGKAQIVNDEDDEEEKQNDTQNMGIQSVDIYEDEIDFEDPKGGQKGKEGKNTYYANIDTEQGEDTREDVEDNRGLEFKIKGYISNANYSIKKTTLMIFINNRLVESTSIRKVVENSYIDILPNHGRPFVFLAIEMPPNHLDVNVHPTKKEVHFLHEDAFLDQLMFLFEKYLSGSNNSRSFYGSSTAPLMNKTSLNPLTLVNDNVGFLDGGSKEASSQESINEKKINQDSSINNENDKNSDEVDLINQGIEMSAPTAKKSPSVSTTDSSKKSFLKKKTPNQSKLVRTDATANSLKNFYYTKKAGNENSMMEQANEDYCNNENEDEEELDYDDDLVEVGNGNYIPKGRASQGFAGKRKNSNPNITDKEKVNKRSRLKVKETRSQYHSIRALIGDIESNYHESLHSLLRRHTFVGVIDEELSLIQHGTKLLLVKHRLLCNELIYQLIIRQFGRLDCLILSNPIPIEPCIKAALDDEEGGWTEADGEKDSLSRTITEHLLAKAGLLDEYFQIRICEKEDLKSKGEKHIVLEGLPQVLPQYRPSFLPLPLFLLHLAMRVDWEDEQACFETIAMEVAELYTDFSDYLSSSNENEELLAQKTSGEKINALTTVHQNNGDRFLAVENVGEEEFEEVIRKEAESLDLLPTDNANLSFSTSAYAEIIQRHFFPAFRVALLPPKQLVDEGVVVQVAALEQLYRVFERC